MNTTSTFSEAEAIDPPPRPRHWRRRTKALTAIGGVVVFAGSAIALDLALCDRDSRTLRFDQPIDHVAVDISGGSIRLIGSDESTITVAMSVRGGTVGPKHRERVVDGRLVIESSCRFGPLTPSCDVDYVVRVPAHVSVDLSGNGLDAQVDAIAGPLDVSINGGDVDATFSAAPQRITARANGGAIDVVVPNDQYSYKADASSNGGSTAVEVRTDPTSDRTIDLHTNGGRITVRYP
jgi:hypothetical protein